MATLVLFNKPYGVLSQFTGDDPRTTLAHYIPLKNVYPAGRLDQDSEGLLLLTDSGKLQHWIAGKKLAGKKQAKRYWVQVEGEPSVATLQKLRQGIALKDGPTLPLKADIIEPPALWPRNPPIRIRQHQPTTWLALVLYEGRNRQIRRMTAAVGHPTLRLVRHRIANWSLDNLAPGEWQQQAIHLPE